MSKRRYRGFLTHDDRTTLTESEPEQYPRNFHTRTRERLRQGLADLAFSSEKLSEDDIAEVFEVLMDPDQTEETSFSREPFDRETIVSALSLFFQAVDLVGSQDDDTLETLIRDAVLQAYRSKLPDQVVSSVDVELNIAPRQETYERAREKYRDGEFLTSTEMRALIDAEVSRGSNKDGTYSRDEPPVNYSDIKQYVVNHLDEIEPGLELAEFQPKETSDQSSVPDLVCEDREGTTVLVEWRRESVIPRKLEGVQTLMKQYGGPDRIRAIILAPNDPPGKSRERMIELGIEFRRLQVGSYGTIKGIENTDFQTENDTS